MLSSATWTRRKTQRRRDRADKDRAIQNKARIKKEVLMRANSMRVDTSLSKMYLPYKLQRRLQTKSKKKCNCSKILRASKIDSLNMMP